MGKIRDWMHGSGRKTVIAVVTVIAANGDLRVPTVQVSMKRYHQSHRKIIMSAAAV